MDAWNEELRRAFAIRVNRLRAARGLTRKQLAARIGSSSALGRWGKGRTSPRTEFLVRLGAELDVTLDYLVLGRGPKHPGTSAVDTSLLQLKEVIEATPRDLREALAHALLGMPIPALSPTIGEEPGGSRSHSERTT
jgi:transcriptional regulator with XRE-family HTH domain